jgi:hypothetical protein
VAYLDLKNAVIRLSPNQISSALAGEVVNAAYNRVIRARNWSSNHVYSNLSFNAPYTTGTVTANSGSSTIAGVGTGWTATIALYKFFQIGNSNPIRITTFNNATSITLDDVWGKPTAAGSAYRLIDNHFSLGTNNERILSMSGEGVQLERTNTEFLNKVDPTRVQRDTPRYYAEFEYHQSPPPGQPPPNITRREFEVWPVPHEDLMLSLWKKVLPVALSGDTDIPVVPETLIEYSAQAEGCRILFGRTGDANWVQLGQTYEGLFKDALSSYMAEDMISQAEPPAPPMGAAA